MTQYDETPQPDPASGAGEPGWGAPTADADRGAAGPSPKLSASLEQGGPPSKLSASLEQGGPPSTSSAPSPFPPSAERGDRQEQPSSHPLTPADAADAARLVSFGLQPKLLPARDAEYSELLRRYRDDPAFARLADAVATGLGLVVLEVSTRAGMAVTADEDSVFAVRMGDYARRASADSADRFLHGLAHLAVAALAFPRPEDLADDGYIGRITVNGVDAFVRQACRRLEERAEQEGENTDPATDAPGLESAWRIYSRRSATGATKDARRLAGSTTGIIAKAVTFLVDSGFLQRTGDDAGGAYRTTARYQLQVRDMAGSAAMAELLELGIVPVTDGSAALLPGEDTDDLALVADAGLPFHSG